MAAQSYVYIIGYIIIALSSVSGLQTVNGTIKITVGTTSGCVNAVNFISNQLVEAYRLYSHFLELEFVPWGRTTRNESGILVCQFGPDDCWANRHHRCALNMLRGDEAAQLRFMQCEFATPFPSFRQGRYTCSHEAGLRLVDIDNCVATFGPDDELDRAAEEAARLPMQVINFIPPIVFNNQPNVTLHNQARARLASLICFALADDPSTGITGCTI